MGMQRLLEGENIEAHWIAEAEGTRERQGGD